MRLIDTVTCNATRPAAGRDVPSARDSFAGMLSSELRAGTMNPTTGSSVLEKPEITAILPIKAKRAFSPDIVRQLINGPVTPRQAQKSVSVEAGKAAYAQAASIIAPGIAQLPLHASPVSVAPDDVAKKAGSIDIAKIVDFKTEGYKSSSNNASFQMFGGNPSVTVGSRSKVSAGDWDKYRMESVSANKKGSSILAGGVMISLKVPL